MTNERNEIELTDGETELYDRQIRLWGLDSQKRIRAANILLCGLSGLGAEIAKNIILAGIKSITFLDHLQLDANDACVQFLADSKAIGQNRAAASLRRAQALNPLVEISVDEANLADKPDAFFGTFSVVVAIGAPEAELLRLDRVCRAAGVNFFAGDLWGAFGWSFADLNEHTFVEDVIKHKIVTTTGGQNKSEKVVTVAKRTLSFPPLERTLAFDIEQPTFVKKLRRTGPAIVLLRVLQAFRKAEGRDPLPSERDADLVKLVALRDQIGGSAPEQLSDAYFGHVFAQISPAAAIVGGELAQEIIKAVSEKEAPHHNVFFFDPDTCCGFVELLDSE